MSTPGFERWLPVVGYEGIYEVSDLGKVRSLDRWIITATGSRRFFPGKTRKVYLNSNGYLRVDLALAGKETAKFVHRLVMEAFAGPCPDGMEVCHGPGGKIDNSIKNLSYGTKSKNYGADKLRDGKDSRGEKHGRAILTKSSVIAIRESTEATSILARRHGASPPTIRDVRSGRSWTWIQCRQPSATTPITQRQ